MQFSAVVVHIATFVVCDMGQYRTNLMGAVIVVFDLMITERWPCTVGVLEWCQVTASVCAWSFRTRTMCSSSRIHVALVTY